MNRLAAVAGLAAAVALFAGCEMESGEQQAEADQQAEERTEQRVEGALLVESDQFESDWPLTVDRGYVDCEPPGIATLRAEGTTYALNGMAQSRGYPEIDPIWRDNPEISGAKVNIGPLIDLALEECE